MEMQSHLQKSDSCETHVTVCIPVYQMWGREFTTLELPTRDQGRGVVAYRPFPVGASNVYGLPWKLDILQELADPFQAGLDHGLAVSLW
jgi:hypothetical protein